MATQLQIAISIIATAWDNLYLDVLDVDERAESITMALDYLLEVENERLRRDLKGASTGEAGSGR